MIVVFLSVGASAQTHTTVRKHRVAEEDRAGALVAKAEAALEKKDYATAEPLLNEAAKLDPEDYRAWYDLGFVLNATGRKPEAIAAYRKAVAAGPQIFETNLNLGLMLAQAKDPEAEKYLRKATKLRPTANVNLGLERAYLSLAHLIEEKDPAGALDAYAQAAKLEPKDAEPRLSAGALLERQGKFADAEKEYRQAATLDPRSGDALVGLVNVFQKSGRLDQAEDALQKFTALHPDNAAAHLQLGRLLAASHKRMAAIEAYEAGLRLQPDDRAARKELAALYDVASKFDQAEAAYRLLLQTNPNDAEAHAGLGTTLLHEHKPAEAQAELLQALKLDPKLGDAYGDLAIAASENKQYGLVIQALDARAKLLDENPGTYFLRATAYDNLHDRQHAIEYYRHFLAVANGRFPDQEWQARHRLVALEGKK